MYDEAGVSMMKMSAKAFSTLSTTKRNKAALAVLDKPVNVNMYISNRPVNTFTHFIIKTTSFCDEKTDQP
jgi:hypothetical protein